MFSPREVSRLLNIPESTLRRYAGKVGAYLSEGAQRRKRIYSESDLNLLRQVRDLAAQGARLDDIPAILGKVIDLPPEVTQQNAIQITSRALTEIKQIRERLGDLDDVKERLAKLEAREAFYRLPWWKRIFRSPPE